MLSIYLYTNIKNKRSSAHYSLFLIRLFVVRLFILRVFNIRLVKTNRKVIN